MRDHLQSPASCYGRTIPPVIDDVYTAALLEKLALLVWLVADRWQLADPSVFFLLSPKSRPWLRFAAENLHLHLNIFICTAPWHYPLHCSCSTLWQSHSALLVSNMALLCPPWKISRFFFCSEQYSHVLLLRNLPASQFCLSHPTKM